MKNGPLASFLRFYLLFWKVVFHATSPLVNFVEFVGAKNDMSLFSKFASKTL